MDPAHRVQVIFEPDLSEAEVELRLQAIRLISGVARVETEASGTRVPGPQEGLTIEERQGSSSGGSVAAQRELIQKALLWGVKEGRLQAGDIQSMGAEETIAVAMKLLDQMPDWEKRQLSKDFSDHGGL